MTDHVDDLAEAISRARIENTCFSEGPGEIDVHSVARAVLLHLRDAPSEDDFAATVGPEGVSHGADRLALDLWQTMFDWMLRRE